jgi:hypothetical protein
MRFWTRTVPETINATESAPQISSRRLASPEIAATPATTNSQEVLTSSQNPRWEKEGKGGQTDSVSCFSALCFLLSRKHALNPMPASGNVGNDFRRQIPSVFSRAPSKRPLAH